MPDESGPTLPTPEFAGSATEYLKQQPMREQKQADANEGGGGLFGDSIGAKVARGMLYMIPVAGQIVDAKERAVVANKHQVNQLILNAALKGKDPALLQDPTVQKAAQGLFGKGGQAFLGVAHHVLSSEIGAHNDWIATMQKHGYGQPGVNPTDAMNAAAAEFVANKKAIPKEAQALITKFAYQPAIGAATQAAEIPAKAATAAAQEQARINTRTDPNNVGATAAAGAYAAGERTKATETAKQPFEEQKRAQHKADVMEAEKRKEAIADRRATEKDLLAQKHKAEDRGEKNVPQATLKTIIAFNQKGEQIDLPPDTTFDQLDQIRAQGGTVHTKSTWQSLVSNFTSGSAPAPPKGGRKLSPAEEANAYFGSQ